MPPTAHFRQGIEANLRYWREQLNQLTDARMHLFIQEQANIILAVELGLALSAAQVDAGNLLLLGYPFIERCGYWQRWLALFEKASAADWGHDALLHIRLLNRQGQLLRLMQQSAQAIALHEKAEALARTTKNRRVLAEVWFNLSVDYWQRDDSDRADAYGQQALATFEALPDCQKWQATMLNTLGLISLYRSYLEEAQAQLQRSFALWEQFDEPTEQARVLNNLASTYLRQDQLEVALHYYRQALERLAPTESALDKAEVLINLGALYFRWAQYDKAEIALRQANSPSLRRSGNFRLRALLAQNLGNTLLKQEQPAEAESTCARV